MFIQLYNAKTSFAEPNRRFFFPKFLSTFTNSLLNVEYQLIVGEWMERQLEISLYSCNEM